MLRVVEGLSPAPAVVLVRPLHPGNIGAVARAMLNFGFSDLRLVAPVEKPWKTEEAIRMAVEANVVLDSAREFDTVEDAVADLHLVLATAARDRSANQPVLTALRGCTEAATACRSGQRVGLVFGSERHGLRTAEIQAAHALVQIPAQEGCSVLNLSQAVVVLAYQFRCCSDDLDAATSGTAAQTDVTVSTTELSTYAQLEGLLTASRHLLQSRLTSHRLELKLARVRDLLLRLRPTVKETHFLRGLLKDLMPWIDVASGGCTARTDSKEEASSPKHQTGVLLP